MKGYKWIIAYYFVISIIGIMLYMALLPEASNMPDTEVLSGSSGGYRCVFSPILY